jgi:hypothetical protein
VRVRAALVAVAAAATVGLFAALPSAEACGCGPATPLLVAHGKSLGGIPWQIKAGEERFGGTRQVTIGFSVGRPGETNDDGYFSGTRLPISRRFVVTGTSGSGPDPETEEDVSGFASRRAARIVATMSEGPPVEVATQVAPPALRQRYPWLRNLEFFDQWYPSGPQVKRLVAYGRAGQVIGTFP